MLYYSKHVFTIDLTKVVAFVQTFSSDAFRLSSITIDRTKSSVKGTGNSFHKLCIWQWKYVRSFKHSECPNSPSVQIPLTYSGEQSCGARTSKSRRIWQRRQINRRLSKNRAHTRIRKFTHTLSFVQKIEVMESKPKCLSGAWENGRRGLSLVTLGWAKKHLQK